MPNVSPNIKGRGGRGGGHRGRSKLTPNKGAVIRASNTEEIKCKFCNHGGQEDKVFGKLHTLENVSAHYNCLLFSSGLAQNGEEEEGIKGFFIDDIIKELRRSSKLKCCYCHQKGASIGCLERRCKRSYHFLCGLKAFSLFQFTGIFSSYCVNHRPFQEGVNKGKEVECPICMEELIADPKIAVWAPCCKKDDWFHKECVQNMANSAGYFFKCPLCNDKDTFTENMQLCGIHVPEQDAEWELEPNAFSDLYERRIHCDAPVCKCPEGRKQDDEGTRWEILLCDLCGTTGVHMVCGRLSFTCTKWNCSSCVEMLEESNRRSKQEVRERRLAERKERTPIGRGRGRRGARQSLNITIPDSNPSRTVITSSSTGKSRRGRPGQRGGRQSLNVTLPVCSPSRTVITSPTTPKRRRTSDPLVLPRKIARIENTPIKEAKRALLTPNKEPVVELERIKITLISNSEDIDIEVEDKVSLSGVSRSLTKLMECETTTSSSDITGKENTYCGANKSDKLELNCDIKGSDTPERSDLEIKNVNKEKDVDEIESSSISVMEMVPNINEKNQGLSPDDNIRIIEEGGGELPESAIELKNFALLAQEIMNELRLTEAEVLVLASNSTDVRENVAKSDIARFFRYNLSIKKMKEIRKLLESAFSKREANIKTSQQSTRRRKPKEDSPTSKNILGFLSPPKTPSRDINFMSDSTPTKDKGVKSENLNFDSNENIDVASSASTKDEPVSPMKRSNKLKSVGGVLDTDKIKSSTICDNQINRKASEELEPKTSESEETPTKVEKVECIKMKSQETQTPDKNWKGSLGIQRKYPGSNDISVHEKNFIPRMENKYWKPHIQQETVCNIASFSSSLMQHEDLRNYISNSRGLHSDDFINRGFYRGLKMYYSRIISHQKLCTKCNHLYTNKLLSVDQILNNTQRFNNKSFQGRPNIGDKNINASIFHNTVRDWKLAYHQNTDTLQWNCNNHYTKEMLHERIDRNNPHYQYSSLSDFQYVQKYKQYDLRHIINGVKLNRFICNSKQQNDTGHIVQEEPSKNTNKYFSEHTHQMYPNSACEKSLEKNIDNFYATNPSYQNMFTPLRTSSVNRILNFKGDQDTHRKYPCDKISQQLGMHPYWKSAPRNWREQK